jgi:hypothetical protein
MPTLARAVITAMLGVLLSGCGDETTEIPADAVSEVRDLMGSNGEEALTLAPTEVERLAALSNVEPDALTSMASSLTESDVWTQSMAGVQTIYDEAPEGVEPALVDVACTAMMGEIHTELQLHYAIYQRVYGFDEQQIDGLTETTFDLYQVIYEASGSDRAEDRAGAALTCHTLGETQD